jgi:uncharacterized protein
VRIGLISDTHNFFDPEIPRIFATVDHILHAGDIGSPRIILRLEEIAPVTAVLGNTDDPGLHYRESELVELGGKRFFLHHIVDPHRPAESLATRLASIQPDVVVFGHSHRPFNQLIGKTLFLNPGSAGKARFGLDRTLAILHCSDQGFRPEFFRLE